MKTITQQTSHTQLTQTFYRLPSNLCLLSAAPTTPLEFNKNGKEKNRRSQRPLTCFVFHLILHLASPAPWSPTTPPPPLSRLLTPRLHRLHCLAKERERTCRRAAREAIFDLRRRSDEALSMFVLRTRKKQCLTSREPGHASS